jgi:hypothetical protein
MKILDTDILTLFFHGHRRVVARRQRESDEVAVTIVKGLPECCGLATRELGGMTVQN